MPTVWIVRFTFSKNLTGSVRVSTVDNTSRSGRFPTVDNTSRSGGLPTVDNTREDRPVTDTVSRLGKPGNRFINQTQYIGHKTDILGEKIIEPTFLNLEL